MASKYYFDKELKDIELKEAALLAGLVQMPNYYNPFVNYEAAEERRNVVLKRMFEEEYITEEMFEETNNIPLETYLSKGQINENIGIYSSYIDYVISEASQNYGVNLNTKDIKITINVDSEIQNYVYQIMNNKFNNFPDDELKCGIIVLDNKSADILAISGSRESGLRNLNYATEVYNQPGSTIKPILSYAPAIEYLNYQPLTQILDEPYKYNDGMTVKNWDNRYLGNISLRYSLSNSRNVPAIKLYNAVGSELAWEFANSIGLENRDGFAHESQAIGGFTTGYSVLEMANSYLSFANMGKYKKASSILSIEVDNIKLVNETSFKQVMSEETAFLINNILHDVLRYTKYDLSNTYLSSKTGQSNYDYNTRMKYNIPVSATKDSWVIGYTKDITVAVWCGYDNLNKGLYLTTQNKDIPIDIMHQIISKFAVDGNYYETPKKLHLMNVEIVNGLIYEGIKGAKNTKQDYFYEGFTPLLRDNLSLYIV